MVRWQHPRYMRALPSGLRLISLCATGAEICAARRVLAFRALRQAIRVSRLADAVLQAT
jgi:hypothetical protein